MISNTRNALLCILVVLFRSVNPQRRNQEDSYYHRYEYYPPYCSTPEQMKGRSIPPLVTKASTTRILHATVVIRHGARTPTSARHDCWLGHWDPPEGIWNCSSNTFMATNAFANDNSFVWLDKRYDGLVVPPNVPTDYENQLHGSCQAGQLIVQGYQQQIINGNQLRDAYVYNQTHEIPVNMRLFDTANHDEFPFLEPTLYFRSDEDQRTLASGQILLNSLFGPEFRSYKAKYKSNPWIRLHTADRSRDIVSPNSKLCPRLKQLGELAQSDHEYQVWSNTDETKILERLMKEELGGIMDNGRDCLMTSICTDRSIPKVLNDYAPPGISNTNDDDNYTRIYGPNRFQRVLNHVRSRLLFQP